MAQSGVTDRDRGWNAATKMLTSLNGLSLTVGIHESADNAVELSRRLFINEFGTDRIPERPAVRSWFDSSLESHFSQVRRIVLTSPSASFAQAALRALGREASDALQQALEDWSEPPNAPATIAKKGFNNPLIETRDMKNAISSDLSRRYG